jgi:hypothetical protein
MASAKEHRRYAAQYLALAQTAATSEDRARLLQMVQAWIELAEKLSTQSHSAAIGRLARTRHPRRGQRPCPAGSSGLARWQQIKVGFRSGRRPPAPGSEIHHVLHCHWNNSARNGFSYVI